MKTQKTAEKFRNKVCADSVIVSILCSLFERARTRERQLYDCSTEFTLNCWRGLPPTANIIYSIDLAIDSQPKCSQIVYRRICIYFTINFTVLLLKAVTNYPISDVNQRSDKKTTARSFKDKATQRQYRRNKPVYQQSTSILHGGSMPESFLSLSVVTQF